jgi:hypothetical protein
MFLYLMDILSLLHLMTFLNDTFLTSKFGNFVLVRESVNFLGNFVHFLRKKFTKRNLIK